MWHCVEGLKPEMVTHLSFKTSKQKEESIKKTSDSYKSHFPVRRDKTSAAVRRVKSFHVSLI